MRIIDIASQSWRTSRENQRFAQQALKDPDLDFENSDAEQRLLWKSGGLGRITEFLTLVRDSIARIHAESEKEVGNESPDDVLSNISSTLAGDLSFRVSRKTLKALLSHS